MSKNPSLVQSAVAEALSLGYQINPDAISLLRKLDEKRKDRAGEKGIGFESIVRAVVEQKAKASASKTIEASDLRGVFPDLFDLLDVAAPAQKDLGLEHVNESPEVEIIEDPSLEVQPTGVEGFSQLFKSRYEKIVKILAQRPEGRQLTKISRLNSEKGNVKVAGLVFSKKTTPNGGLEFTIDDDTGSTTLLALSSEAKKSASDIALDQCVMVDADAVDGKLMVKNVIQPDVPSRFLSTSKKTAYAVFLSDLHVGSNKFMDGAFSRFLEWLSGRGVSEEDQEVIRRLKYVVIGGDIVDGVGVFPNQEYELIEQDVFRQYEMVAKKLSLIPRNLQVFVIPGNHDATRQALPQPMIPKKYASSLYNQENLRMLGDPCLFKLSGVSVLCYHGRSLDDVLATTPGLSYEKPQEAMKVLLRARHLAPIFGLRTPIAPEIEDHLVIDEVPDIFHAGHVHTVGVERYKSTLIINSGTWQAQTGYQANLGISPRPGIVPIVNLATIDITWREFLTSSSLNPTRAA